MITSQVLAERPSRRAQALSILFTTQFLLGPFGLLLTAALPVAAAPVESQDSATEIITARIDFNGTDGSLYSATRAGPQGAELGTVVTNFTLGQGYWGEGATLSLVRVAYPGNLSLAPSFSANEVFYARSGAAPRDKDANGTTLWTAATPTDSYLTLAFDQDGDGYLDDAVLGYTGVANRYYTYNQAGTQLGMRNLAPGTTNLNELAAIDSDSNGILDQFAVGHMGGLVYVERAPANNMWSTNSPGNAPVRFVAGVDLNGDGFLEGVLAGADDWTVDNDEAVYAYNAAGAPMWTYFTGGPASGIVNLTGIEAASSHRLNGALVATNTSITVVGAAGRVVWNWTTNATVTAAAAVDFNHDGIPEGVAYADDTGAVSFLDGTGALIGYEQLLTGPVRSIAALDLNADGYVDEVVAANDTTVVGLDNGAGWLWNVTVGAGFRINMLARGDFDGNGTYGDTIVPTTNTLYVYNRTGGLRWSAAEGRNIRSAAFIENPSAASSGSYLSPELDAGAPAGWTDFTQGTAVDTAFESVSGWLRFGDGIPGNVTWQPWVGPILSPSANFTGNTSRFVQFRYDFTSTDGRNSANVSFFKLNYNSPALTGSVVTPPISPSPQAAWLDLNAQLNLSGGAVRLFYSADGGTTWAPFTPGQAVDAANASAPSLRFRVEMDMGVGSPTVAFVSARYAQAGLRPAVTSPTANSTITGAYNLTAMAVGAITGLTFAYVPPGNTSPVFIGAAAYDSVGLRWWVLWNTSLLSGAPFEVRATGTDARGFRFTGALAPFAIDNSPPVVSIKIPSAGAVLSNTVTVEATSSSDTVSVAFSYVVNASSTPIGFSNQTSPGIWNTTWDTTTAPYGELANVGISATATDGVGLAGTDTLFPVVVDNVAPWVTIDDPTAGSQVQGITRVNLTSAPDVVSIDLYQNGSEGSATLGATTAAERTWVFNWSTLPDVFNSSANLTAIARDRAGHTGTTTVFNLTINNTAPQPTLLAPAVRTIYTGAIFVAASAPSFAERMEFFYQDASGSPISFHNMTAAEKNATSGLWEFIWDSQADGANFNGSILVEAWPAVGPPGVDSSDDWILVDNRPPSLRFSSPAFGTVRISGNYTVEVQSDATDAVAMSLSYLNPATNQTVFVGNMTRDSTDQFLWRYTWSIDASTFVAGATLTVSAVDRVGLTGTASFFNLVIGSNPSDSPPRIVRSPTDVFLDEDFGSYLINLAGLIVDEDPGNATVYLDWADPALVTVVNNGSRATDAALWLFSVQDAHSKGTQTPLQLRVVDSLGQQATAIFGLLVAPKNDPPSWRDPHDTIYVQAGVPYTIDFSFYVHDVEFEQENASLFITTEDGAHIFQNSSWRLALTLDYNASFLDETIFVNLSLSDGDPAFPPQRSPLRIIVTNDAVPRLTAPIPTIELTEDTPRSNILDLHAFFHDPDEEPLFYYWGLPEGFTVDISGGNVSVTELPKDWWGNTSLFLGANDALGAFAETRVNITVHPVNDAPDWDFSRGFSIDTFSVHWGLPFLFDLGPYVRDVDSPRSALTLYASQPLNVYALSTTLNGSELAAPGAGLILVFDFGAPFNGLTEDVTIFVTDGFANSTAKNIRIFISDNYPPASTKALPSEIVLYEGERKSPALNLSQYFHDPDGVLFYAFGLVNVTVTIDNDTGLLTLDSPGEWSGTEVLIIRTIDNRSAFLDSTIIVTVLSVDDAPKWARMEDIKIDAGVLGRIFIWPSVSDIDTNKSLLTYSVSSGYPNAFVAYSNGNVTFVYPKPSNAGEVLPSFDNLKICASDGEKVKCTTVAITINQQLVPPFNWLLFFIFVGTAGAGAIVVARHFVEFKIKRPPTVEDIFLVYEDGILIKHISKNVRKYADEDVVTSMLSAIQSFAADSFEDKKHWELREIQFQGRKILIEKARKFQIFLIFDGDANEDLKKAVREAAAEIQTTYKQHLKDWDGDPSHFDGVERIFAPLLSIESAFIPEEVTADELVKAPLVPGAIYVSEADGFGPLIKAYAKDLEGVAVVRLRPATEEGQKLDPLKAKEVETIEVSAPRGIPGDEDDGKTGLDQAIDALKEALQESKVAVRGRAPLVLFEGFEFIVDRYGFVFSKKFADQLKKLASTEGFYLFIAVSPTQLSPQQLEGLERGAVVFRGA
jgi:hypothetical protein